MVSDGSAPSDSVFDATRDALDRDWLLPQGGGALIMVSGGSDSTALAYLFARLREEDPERLGALAMFHMHHGLRGEDADRDAAFAGSLAEHLGIPFFLCEMDIAGEAARTGENVEALARRERYSSAMEALSSMCFHEGVPLDDSRIVTAHTADDRIENLYMRTIVGTGPGGFRGMARENGNVIRPLITCTRDELRSYITGLGEAALTDGNGSLWCEDATNAHTDRFRAYVRHTIVPAAKEWNPSLASTLTRTMDLIADEDDMLDEMACAALDRGSEWIDATDHAAGCVLEPSFGEERIPLQKRAVRMVLKEMLGAEERIDTASVDAVLDCFDGGVPRSGHVANIQGDIAVSSNKRGVRIEPMAAFRARRKKG